MSEAGLEAGSPRAVVTRSRGTKTPGGAKRPAVATTRVQLHLGETTAKRLSVHAALVGRNASRVADEILIGYLARFGKGREVFKDDPVVQVTDPTGD